MKEVQSDREVSVYLSFLLRHHPETAGLDMDRHGWVSVAQPWVEPELTYGPPPETLYHGTTAEAWAAIQAGGYISRMARHAVHMQADRELAWKSARRWRKEPVVLVIDAGRMHRDGGVFGASDNGVWCAERVDTAYISGVLRR